MTSLYWVFIVADTDKLQVVKKKHKIFYFFYCCFKQGQDPILVNHFRSLTLLKHKLNWVLECFFLLHPPSNNSTFIDSDKNLHWQSNSFHRFILTMRYHILSNKSMFTIRTILFELSLLLFMKQKCYCNKNYRHKYDTWILSSYLYTVNDTFLSIFLKCFFKYYYYRG